MMRLTHWMLGFLSMACLSIACEAAGKTSLRVQLKWIDQAQFSGFYVAEKKGYFAEEGLEVETLAGGPGIDPLASLRAGKSDVVVATYTRARMVAGEADPIVNVAQILEQSPLRLMCLRARGIDRLQDVAGKSVAISVEQDRGVVDEMLAAAGAATRPHYQLRPDYDVNLLLQGKVDCLVGELYSEYRKLLRAGQTTDAIAVFKPADVGVQNLEDGLYVPRSRLDDPEFVDHLAHLVRALRRGWEDVRKYPAEALDITLRKNPAIDRTEQTEMLESILTLLKERDLLYFDPERVHTTTQQASPLWTHAVWNRALELEGRAETFSRATLFQAGLDEKSPLFALLLMFGFCAFALAATLDAVSQGYDLWGRLVIALVSVMGGGILRDLILARNRLPFSFLENPSVPIAITTVVIAYSLLLIVWPEAGRTRGWIVIRRHAEAVGFAIVTVYGALACILAGTHWYWAPFGAAMTIAGGGIIRDIIVNREPRNFRGAIFEEIAVLSGLLVVIGLVVANRFEHAPWVVHAVLAGTVVVITVIRLMVVKYDLRYPRWLAQPAPPP
jgi:uncharacterized membrane protein YeiH/ABC-type nitrate/sulfonate/bicarbonate transport system substrate-binding protein